MDRNRASVQDELADLKEGLRLVSGGCEATSCELAGGRSLQLSSRYVCGKCLADQRASGPQADARAEALEAEIESRDAELAVAAGKLAQMAGLMQQVDALNKQARMGWAAGGRSRAVEACN